MKELSDQYSVDISVQRLPIESSRGCWWGRKNHCVFCGIRDEDLAYRVGSEVSVLSTMVELRERYSISKFRFADYILPRQYFKTLFAQLACMKGEWELSGEIKANIRANEFRLLADAGFVDLQPGIESFSSSILRKMRKGVTGAQNVHVLLLGRESGVRVFYNILYGFPGDELTDYEQLVHLLPLLMHLDPPMTCLPVQVTRYSPLHMQPELFGLDNADPEPCYELVFSQEYVSKTGFDLRDYCYYFMRPFENSLRLQQLYERVEEIVARWWALYSEQAAWLYAEPADKELIVHDRRTQQEKVYRLSEVMSRILLMCTRPTQIPALNLSGVSAFDVEVAVKNLEAQGLVFRDEDRLISLVMSKPPPSGVEPNHVPGFTPIPQSQDIALRSRSP